MFDDPTWAGEPEGRDRVLIECPPHLSPRIIADSVERMGYSVRFCEGPDGHRCRLVDEGSCALVSGADIVVNFLGRGGHDRRQVLEHVHGERRPPELVVEVTTAEQEQLRRDGYDVTFVSRPARAASLADALREASRRSHSTGRRAGSESS